MKLLLAPLKLPDIGFVLELPGPFYTAGEELRILGFFASEISIAQWLVKKKGSYLLSMQPGDAGLPLLAVVGRSTVVELLRPERSSPLEFPLLDDPTGLELFGLYF